MLLCGFFCVLAALCPPSPEPLDPQGRAGNHLRCALLSVALHTHAPQAAVQTFFSSAELFAHLPTVAGLGSPSKSVESVQKRKEVGRGGG